MLKRNIHCNILEFINIFFVLFWQIWTSHVSEARVGFLIVSRALIIHMGLGTNRLRCFQPTQGDSTPDFYT